MHSSCSQQHDTREKYRALLHAMEEVLAQRRLLSNATRVSAMNSFSSHCHNCTSLSIKKKSFLLCTCGTHAHIHHTHMHRPTYTHTHTHIHIHIHTYTYTCTHTHHMTTPLPSGAHHLPNHTLHTPQCASCDLIIRLYPATMPLVRMVTKLIASQDVT